LDADAPIEPTLAVASDPALRREFDLTTLAR
jgi:hypothetical protein